MAKKIAQKTNRKEYAVDINAKILKSLQSLLIVNLKKVPQLSQYWLNAINKAFNDDDYIEKVGKDSVSLSNKYINKVNISHAKATKKEYKSLIKTSKKKSKNNYQGENMTGFSGIDKINAMAQTSAADLISTPAIKDALSPIINENINLIRSIPIELLPQVEQEYTSIIAKEGFNQATILKMLTERFSVAKSRAELIASDQVGKTIGELTKVRHQEADITAFEWSTSEDSAVRPEHQALDGKIFEYDHPPSIGLPGQPIRCRCVALAHITDL